MEATRGTEAVKVPGAVGLGACSGPRLVKEVGAPRTSTVQEASAVKGKLWLCAPTRTRGAGHHSEVTPSVTGEAVRSVVWPKGICQEVATVAAES